MGIRAGAAKGWQDNSAQEPWINMNYVSDNSSGVLVADSVPHTMTYTSSNLGLSQ